MTLGKPQLTGDLVVINVKEFIRRTCDHSRITVMSEVKAPLCLFN